MTRVCLAMGTWNLVVLAAALRRAGGGPGPDDRLLLCLTPDQSPEMYRAMERMAAAMWDWKHVAWADRLVKSRGRVSEWRYAALRWQVRRRAGAARADQLWMCRAWHPAEKSAADALPDAAIHVYEDGLGSYVPVPVAAPAARLRPAAHYLATGSAFDPRHLARVAGVHVNLFEGAPVPAPLAAAAAPQFVDDTHLRDALRAALRAFPGAGSASAAPNDQRPTVLVLGQALARTGAFTTDEEFALYRDVARGLLDRGFAVVWKDHPRVAEPYLARLRAEFGGGAGLHAMEMPFALPVEMAAPGPGLAACVGGITSSLFYLPRLWGVPAYTFADALMPRLEGKLALQAAMVREHVPAFADLATPRQAPNTSRKAVLA